VALTIASLAFALVFLAPELAQLPHTPGGDGRFMLHQIEIAKASLRAGELPLWNPFDCRGIPQWEHPEAVAASPLLLLFYPLSSPTTLYLWELVYVAWGFSSMWLLLRDDVGVTRPSALLGACLWAGSPALTMQIVGAHATFHGFYVFPLMLLWWRRAERERAAAIKLGLLGAFLLFEGASYPLPMCLFSLVVEAAIRWARARFSLRALGRMLTAGVAAGVVAAGVGAARLLPLAHQLTTFERRLADDDPIAGATLVDMFLEPRSGGHKVFLQTFGWHEYGAYLGPVCLGLALVGLALSLERRRVWIALLGLVIFVAMLGDFAPYAPWHWLKLAPPFSALRVSSRFRLVLMAPACALVAVALDEIPRRLARLVSPARRVLRVASLAFGAFGVASAVAFASHIVAARFWQAPPALVSPSPNFYYGGAGLTPEYIDQPRQNRAWLGCRNNGWRGNAHTAVWEGDVAQARVVTGEATVTRVTRTLGSFALDVRAESATRVVLDSGYEPGWRANAGTVVGDGPDRGAGGGRRLAVDLPPGSHALRVTYRPLYFRLGVAVSGASLALLAVIGLAVRGRKRRVSA
jgi:hypothetical protein